MPSSLQIKEFGDPSEKIFFAEQPKPSKKNKSLRVQILAAPINPADLNLIEGTYGVRPDLPFSLGVEGTGKIIESHDSQYLVGDQVIFINRVGTWAEEVWVSPQDIIVIEAPIAPLQASMLKVNPMTAWRLLTGFAELSEGDYIIQNAANSGVGQCVIQLAKILGFRSINLVRRKDQIDELIKLGADHVLLDTKDIKNQINELISQDELPKIAFNAVGGDSALRLMDCLSNQGCHITYGAMSKRSLKVPNKFLIFKRISLHGLWVTEDLRELPLEYINETYQNLASWVTEGKLLQKVHKTYSLHNFKEALKENELHDRNGKIIFQPSK